MVSVVAGNVIIIVKIVIVNIVIVIVIVIAIIVIGMPRTRGPSLTRASAAFSDAACRMSHTSYMDTHDTYDIHGCIYIYIYIYRERERHVIYIYIYIYICIRIYTGITISSGAQKRGLRGHAVVAARMAKLAYTMLH